MIRCLLERRAGWSVPVVCAALWVSSGTCDCHIEEGAGVQRAWHDEDEGLWVGRDQEPGLLVLELSTKLSILHDFIKGDEAAVCGSSDVNQLVLLPGDVGNKA